MGLRHVRDIRSHAPPLLSRALKRSGSLGTRLLPPLTKGLASQTNEPVDWLGHVLKQDTHMHDDHHDVVNAHAHAPQSYHLAHAVYIINALYPLSFSVLTDFTLL